MAFEFEKPYLLVYQKDQKYFGVWKTGPDAAAWIGTHANPKRLDKGTHKEPKNYNSDPMAIDSEWLPGELVEARLFKIQVSGVYDTLVEIYNSQSLSASQFIDGVLTMKELLWEIEW